MKKIYLIAVLAIAAFQLNAQNFTYSTVMHHDDAVSSPMTNTYDIKWVTPSPEAITYDWVRISNSFPNGWSYSVCDLGGCYIGCPQSGSMTPISLADAQAGGATAEGMFKLNLTLNATDGNGTLVLYAYDSNDMNRGDTVSFTIDYTDTTTAPNVIMEVSGSNLAKAYPNPASSQINFGMVGSDISAIRIYDVLGKQVEYISTTSASTYTVDVSSLHRGMYIVSYEGNNGALRTEKIILK